MSYWIASLSLLALGWAMIAVSARLIGRLRRAHGGE
jgi:hypothetical protein